MAALNRIFRKTWRSEEGAELIEFAIALPLLLLVVAGIVDFAFLFQRYEVVTNAAREGARVGLLPDFDETDIQNRVNSYLAASGLAAVAPVPDVSYGSVEVTAGGPTIDVVRVEVKYPHQFLFLGPMAALAGGGPHGDIMLTAASTMRREVAAAP